MRVAIVHDYLTQRGGAERVVLSMRKAFPDAPLYTSVYDPAGTFPEFADADIRTSPLNSLTAFRRRPPRALAFLAPTFSRLAVDADVTLCSSSGWAHGCRASGAKIVYCHNPARWLYQSEDYLGDTPSPLARLGLLMLRRPLIRWDKAAAASASRYITQSRIVQSRIAATYGRVADLLPAPASLDASASRTPVRGIEPGFFLLVSRLQPYKNVDKVIEAFRLLDHRLVVVGEGPERARLHEAATPNVVLLGRVDDASLRWLYANSAGLVAAAYEDYGLTPLEALRFERPTAALRYGGFLDTVRDGETGLFFDRPIASEIAGAVAAVADRAWDPAVLRAAEEPFREDSFIKRLREIADEVAAGA